MILRRITFCLGLSQLIAWGAGYYLIGVFGPIMKADLGWSSETIFGGYSLALLVMGIFSPLAGKWIDRHGGAMLMSAGGGLMALSCILLANVHDVTLYYAAWAVMGLALRLTLYDAAFAALAGVAGPGARSAMSGITLLGGLASTVFWPLGGFLADLAGWRGALIAYAAIALLTIPLNATLPKRRYAPDDETNVHVPLAGVGRQRIVAGILYALIFSLVNLLNAAMSAHMIGIYIGLGLAGGLAVGLSTLRGIGQTSARAIELMFGRALDARITTIIAAIVLPVCFAAGLFSALSFPAAVIFALFFGIGNGIMTITRGTLPLLLFDHSTYGAFVGKLLVPGFIFAATGPLVGSPGTELEFAL